MSRTRLALFAGLALFSIASSAKADIEIGASAYTPAPMGTLDALSTSPIAGIASVRGRLPNSSWGIGATAEASRQDLTDPHGFANEVSLSSTLVGGKVEYDFDLTDTWDQVTWYLALGAGVDLVRTTETNLSTATSTSGSHTGIMVAPEAGLRGHILKHLGAGVSLRYEYVALTDTLLASGSSLTTLASFGVNWQLFVPF